MRVFTSDMSIDEYTEKRHEEIISNILKEAGEKKGKLVDESLDESRNEIHKDDN
jgi:hypothetical protein